MIKYTGKIFSTVCLTVAAKYGSVLENRLFTETICAVEDRVSNDQNIVSSGVDKCIRN